MGNFVGKRKPNLRNERIAGRDEGIPTRGYPRGANDRNWLLLRYIRGRDTERKALAADRRGATLFWAYRDCNKAGCTKCPHGPYLFAAEKKHGVWKQRYLGR